MHGPSLPACCSERPRVSALADPLTCKLSPSGFPPSPCFRFSTFPCTDELYHEMPFRHWDQVRHSRWARARTLRAYNQVGVRPIWPVDEEQEGQRRLSWAAATRPLRWLKKRVVEVGGKREFPQEKSWRLADASLWELLFRGEEALWRSAALRAAGYGSVLSLTHETIHDSSSTLDANNRVPLLTREPESRGAKHIRMLIPRGIKG
jgi:hypothetical protein